MAAQKIHATTQKFTEIVDFADDIGHAIGQNITVIFLLRKMCLACKLIWKVLDLHSLYPSQI